jgi:hypothetical protein
MVMMRTWLEEKFVMLGFWVIVGGAAVFSALPIVI